MTLDLQISGKTAIITGANNPHGIGAATAKALAAQGVDVLLHFHQVPYKGSAPEGFGEDYYNAMQAHSAEPLADEITALGCGRAVVIGGDLGEPALVPRLFDAAEAAFGPVQILVNNAAHSVPDSFLPGRSAEAGDRAVGGLGMRQDTITAESIDRHFAVNTRGTALMMAEFARRHAARGGDWGRIISLSTGGAPGFAGEVSYGASKYAVESCSKAAAKELGRYGITVNVVSPGPVQTGWMGPELEALVERETPLGRAGLPTDLADAILLLVSEQARWITGQVLQVGGGHRID